jgi:hypothetical protein
MTRKQWIAVGVIVALIATPVALKMARSDTNKVVDLKPATTHALSPTVLWWLSAPNRDTRLA